MPRVSVRKIFLYVLAAASTFMLAVNVHQALVGQGQNSRSSGPGWQFGASGSGSGSAGRPTAGKVLEVGDGGFGAAAGKREASKEEGENEEEEDGDDRVVGQVAGPSPFGPPAVLEPPRQYNLKPLSSDDVTIPASESRPWYIKDGKTIPSAGERANLTLLPPEAPGLDRIRDQLMFYPSHLPPLEELSSPETKLKKILLWNGAGSFGGVRPGRGVFLKVSAVY